jgi:hypothetical protein
MLILIPEKSGVNLETRQATLRSVAPSSATQACALNTTTAYT